MATITQELEASRDVLSMIENFKKNAGEDFAAELDVLTADMRSSSYEAGTHRFEARFEFAHAIRHHQRADWRSAW